MTDLEMLELAALAYGFDVATVTSSNGAESTMICDLGDEILCEVDWNPRDDDGDSRRLEVKLGITNTKTLHEAMQSIEDWSDPYAATRLAVLRVAAEIGRQMKEQQP